MLRRQGRRVESPLIQAGMGWWAGVGLIVLFTDYGRNSPYTGLLKAVLKNQSPATPVIDLIANAPACNIKASSYLLAAFVDQFPAGTIFVAVVDPGVGSARPPVVIEADGNWFVGPGNGLFDVLINRAQRIQMSEIDTSGFQLSTSFHGRDIFAPVAAMIAENRPPPVLKQMKTGPVHGNWPDDLYEVIYIDDFGNAFTGIRSDSLSQNTCLIVSEQRIAHSRTFSDAQEGQSFWYGNSIGLIEIAANRDSAKRLLKIKTGTTISVKA